MARVNKNLKLGDQSYSLWTDERDVHGVNVRFPNPKHVNLRVTTNDGNVYYASLYGGTLPSDKVLVLSNGHYPNKTRSVSFTGSKSIDFYYRIELHPISMEWSYRGSDCDCNYTNCTEWSNSEDCSTSDNGHLRGDCYSVWNNCSNPVYHDCGSHGYTEYVNCGFYTSENCYYYTNCNGWVNSTYCSYSSNNTECTY